MLRNLRHLLRLAALALLVSIAPVVGPARADQTVDPTVAAPSNLTALTQSDGYGGQEIVISWFWDTADYDPQYGSFYIEGRDDTAAGQFRWMTGAGTVYSQSVTRGLISSPGVEPGPNDFVPGHTYTLRCYLDVGTGLDAYGVPLTRTGYSNEFVIDIPGIPKPADGPTGLSLYVKAKGRKAILYWNDNSADETGFRIERKDPGGAWREIVTVAANAETWSDTSMGAVGNYAWRVVAEKAGGTETDPSNEREAWCGKKVVACPPPSYGASFTGTWQQDADTSITLAVAGKSVTGTLLHDGQQFDVVLKLRSPTATTASGRFYVSPELWVPGRVLLDTALTSHTAYRSLTVESLKPLPVAGLPDVLVLPGLLLAGTESGRVCVTSGSGLNSAKAGRSLGIVLTFTNGGPRGIPAEDVGCSVFVEGGEIVSAHAGKGVVFDAASTNPILRTFGLPALGNAKLPASGRTTILLQLRPSAGAEELSVRWALAATTATFVEESGEITVPIE